MLNKLLYNNTWNHLTVYKRAWTHLRILSTKCVYKSFFFFIIQRVKARAIPCPHQPPSRGDNTVSVAQGGTATPGSTKQLLPPDRVLRESYIYKYIYIYMPDQLNAETTLDVNLHFLSAVCYLKKRIYFQRLMLLSVYSNRFLRKVVPRVLPSCWKLSRFWPNPTWCISRRGLKTIWGNFQTAASDSCFWNKRNDWVSYKTITTNLNKNPMAYPTLFHTVGTQCLVAVFLPLVCFLPIYKQDLALNNLQWLICHKTKPKQTKPLRAF